MENPVLPVAAPSRTAPAPGTAPKSLSPPDPRATELRRLRRVAGDFESLFLAQLLQSMQRTVGHTNSGSSFGGEVMLGVAQEKMAEGLADKGGLGLGKMLYESLKDRVVPDSASTPERGSEDEAKPIPLRRPESQPLPLTPGDTPRPIDRAQ
jgi:Rod binding domain-containing protein